MRHSLKSVLPKTQFASAVFSCDLFLWNDRQQQIGLLVLFAVQRPSARKKCLPGGRWDRCVETVPAASKLFLNVAKFSSAARVLVIFAADGEARFLFKKKSPRGTDHAGGPISPSKFQFQPARPGVKGLQPSCELIWAPRFGNCRNRLSRRARSQPDRPAGGGLSIAPGKNHFSV